MDEGKRYGEKDSVGLHVRLPEGDPARSVPMARKEEKSMVGDGRPDDLFTAQAPRTGQMVGCVDAF